MNEQFVLHRHVGHGTTHFDLMLEHGVALATWQFETDPAEADLANPLGCHLLPSHRREYLDYEGPVSFSRGHVERVDRGALELVNVQEGQWRFRLSGERLKGLFEIRVVESYHQDWALRRLGD